MVLFILLYKVDLQSSPISFWKVRPKQAQNSSFYCLRLYTPLFIDFPTPCSMLDFPRKIMRRDFTLLEIGIDTDENEGKVKFKIFPRVLAMMLDFESMD